MSSEFYDAKLIGEILGTGTTAEVWKYSWPSQAEIVHFRAFKIYYWRDESAEAAEERGRLALAMSLDHRGLIHIGHVSSFAGRLAIGMDLAECNLWERAQREASLSPLQIVQYFESAAGTIDDIGARGFVHCAITPLELLVVNNELRLSDFSWLHLLGQKFRKPTRASLLSLTCMAPELTRDSPTLRSDQYSLALSYVMLRSGRLRIGMTAAEILQSADVGANERAVLTRALAVAPDHRFATCTEMYTQLRHAVVNDFS
jgi:hypothetical protein